MASGPIITGLEVHQFEVARHGGTGEKRTAYALRVLTDAGVVGEFVGGRPIDFAALPAVAPHVIGKNALERELIYAELKLATRQQAEIGIAPVDIALWDLAGKYHDAPVHRLLGGYRKSLPTYVATSHGEEKGSGALDSPEAYADFAERCLELGFPGFKIHGWDKGPVEREAATIHAVRRRVGARMELMSDPYNALLTFADALRVGRACDDERYFWYEDPLRDGGVSHFAHRKLRQLIKTPLLISEHVPTLEARVDFMVAEATDFVRGDVLHGGITGAMKLAHAAEGLGLDIEFHSPGPAQRQCVAAVRNTNFYELSGQHPTRGNQNFIPVYKDGYRDEMDAADARGHFPVPQGPGLGVEYDWALIKKNRTALVEYN